MWLFRQSTGEIEHDGVLIVRGYSGHGEGKNNPAMQEVHNVGPIPQGSWTISGPPIDSPKHGPYVLHLFPAAGTETFGRDGFLIHGDSLEFVGLFQASHGCIVLPRPARELIWDSGDRALAVVS